MKRESNFHTKNFAIHANLLLLLLLLLFLFTEYHSTFTAAFGLLLADFSPEYLIRYSAADMTSDTLPTTVEKYDMNAAPR